MNEENLATEVEYVEVCSTNEHCVVSIRPHIQLKSDESPRGEDSSEERKFRLIRKRAAKRK